MFEPPNTPPPPLGTRLMSHSISQKFPCVPLMQDFFFKGDDLHFDAADRNTFSFLKRKEEKKKQTEKVCQFSGSRSRGIRVSLYMTDLSDKQTS